MSKSLTAEGASVRTLSRPVSEVSDALTVIEPQRGWRGVEWRELTRQRDLFYFLVLRDITVMYKQTVLGFAWAVVNPVFSMLVFTVVFGTLAAMPSEGVPYPIFSYVALVPWAYFSGAVTTSTSSLIQGSTIFTKVYFPRLFMPWVPVVSKLVDFAVALLILAALMAWYAVPPARTIMFLPVLMILMVLTAAGVGTWLSALAIQYRDVKHAIGLIAQLLMYAAPVVWPLSLVPPRYRLAYGFYPMAGVIEGFRCSILGTNAMPWDLVAASASSALLLFVTGTLYFRRMERIFADVA